MSANPRTTPLHLGVRVGRGNRFAPILPAPPEWTEQALCAQTDPDAFFPEKGGTTRHAKAVCGRCDVRAECLADALDRGERFGIWGGLSERERRCLAGQRRALTAVATEPAENTDAAETAVIAEDLTEERRAA